MELGLPEAGVSLTEIFILQPFGDQILAGGWAEAADAPAVP